MLDLIVVILLLPFILAAGAIAAGYICLGWLALFSILNPKNWGKCEDFYAPRDDETMRKLIPEFSKFQKPKKK